MKKLSLLFIMLLASCAMPPQNDPNSVMGMLAARPLTCADKAQCDLYWSRVQVWLSQNSQFRIQIATPSVIDTYGPDDGEFAYNITRIQHADGSARIHIEAGCGNMYCTPSRDDVIAAIKQFVRGD